MRFDQVSEFNRVTPTGVPRPGTRVFSTTPSVQSLDRYAFPPRRAFDQLVGTVFQPRRPSNHPVGAQFPPLPIQRIAMSIAHNMPKDPHSSGLQCVIQFNFTTDFDCQISLAPPNPYTPYERRIFSDRTLKIWYH